MTRRGVLVEGGEGSQGGSRVQPDSDKRSGIDPLVQSRAIHVMQHRYGMYTLTDDQSTDFPRGVYDLDRVRL